MSDIKINFIGAEYTVPSELCEFIDYLHYFESLHNNEIMPLLTNQMQRKEYSGGADTDFVYFKNPLVKIGEKIIAKLAEDNIYDATINDFVFNNKGYLQLHNVCSETMQGMVDILMNAMQTWLDGYENAYSSAAATVTGSGVSIWTNSLSSALIYSAMEASTIKKQADKADIQYRNAMSSLSANVNSEQEKQKRNLLINKYYPGVAESLALFVSEMMELYVFKLEQHNVFNYSIIKEYNLQRSSDLLKNIKLVKNKTELLKEAFQCCPYNPDVYNAAMECGLADIPTFETAKYFKQDSILVDVIEKYAINNAENIDLIEIPVKVLALYKEKDEISIWKNIYSDEYLKLHKHYTTLLSCFETKISLLEWTKNNITEDAVILTELTDVELIEKINKAVCQQIISDALFDLFKKIGLLDNDFIALNVATPTKDEINCKLAEKMFDSIKQIIPIVNSHIEQVKAEIIDAKKELESSQQAYDAMVSEVNSKIANLQKQREALGLFAFSKKKEIDKQIQECNDTLTAFKNTDKTQQLKKEYEQLQRKMHSLKL